METLVLAPESHKKHLLIVLNLKGLRRIKMT